MKNAHSNTTEKWIHLRGKGFTLFRVKDQLYFFKYPITLLLPKFYSSSEFSGGCNLACFSLMQKHFCWMQFQCKTFPRLLINKIWSELVHLKMCSSLCLMWTKLACVCLFVTTETMFVRFKWKPCELAWDRHNTTASCSLFSKFYDCHCYQTNMISCKYVNTLSHCNSQAVSDTANEQHRLNMLTPTILTCLLVAGLCT